MVKNNLSDIFSDLNSESSVIIPKSIKIKNIKSVDTISDATSSFMPQKQGYSDATSSFMPQKGGYSDATSSFMPQKGGQFTSSNKKNNKDIKQLISMLSPTSESNYTANNNDTEQLRDNLFNILQDGGSPGIMSFYRGYKAPIGKSVPTVPDRAPGGLRDSFRGMFNWSPAQAPVSAPAPVPVSPRAPVPVSPRASDTKHTHIIYTCCLIERNVVRQIVKLKEENIKNKKITRIYMNINPFNIWGSSFKEVAFGPKYFKGIKYFQGLFRSEGLLKEDIVDDTKETYENAITFINGLRTVGIILFDSADYLLKPFLFDTFKSKEDAIKMIEESKLLSTKEEQNRLIKYLDFEIGERQRKKQPGIPVPYEWYLTTLGDYVNCKQAIESFGYKKALNATVETHPDELFKIKDMAEEYNREYILRFTTQEHKTDPIRCIEHRRIILELIDKHFPISSTEKVALLNKALKSLVFYPSINDLPKWFTDEKHLEYINSIPRKFFMQCEKWFSTYRFSVVAPKVYFDFTGLLFIMNNLSNEDFLKPLTEENIKQGSRPIIIDTDKIQNQIIDKCIELKKYDPSENAKTKPPNAYIVKLIENVKDIHTELEDFTIVTDLEGDDLTAEVAAYKFLPKQINLNIIIQHSRGIKTLHDTMTMTMPKVELKFKEETLDEWCREQRLPISLLTVNSILEFYIIELKLKHDRANFTTIDINYEEMIPSIRKLLKDVKGINVDIDTTLEFFEYTDSTKGKLPPQPVINGISPNICKVADALLQLYGTDSSLITRLLTHIRKEQADHQSVIARKYLKKNIY